MDGQGCGVAGGARGRRRRGRRGAPRQESGVSTTHLFQPDRALGATTGWCGASTRATTASRCMRTDNNTVLKKIKVGDEPQSVALDPNNKFAFVANAAGSSVTVIKIINAKPGGFAPSSRRRITTGAEPWNIVISPDGKRVFVANSGQDTITVINALSHAHHRPGQPAQQPVQRPRPQPPLPAARAGGEPGQQPTVRHPLPVVHQAGRQRARTTKARRAWSAGSTSTPTSTSSAATSRPG